MSSIKTLPQVHIIHYPSPTQISSFSRKGGENYVNPQFLVKFYPPGLILDIGPFWFAAFLNHKSFNAL